MKKLVFGLVAISLGTAAYAATGMDCCKDCCKDKAGQEKPAQPQPK